MSRCAQFAVAVLVVCATLSTGCGPVGKDAGRLEVDYWFNAGTSMNRGKATLLVFWEYTDSKSRGMLNIVNRIHAKYQSRGLNTVAITQLKRSDNKEIKTFVDRSKFKYSVAREKGDMMTRRFGIRRTPMLLVVKDGTVVWADDDGLALLWNPILDEWL